MPGEAERLELLLYGAVTMVEIHDVILAIICVLEFEIQSTLVEFSFYRTKIPNSLLS